MKKQVQKVLNHLIQFNINRVAIPGKTYQIKEIRMGSLSVIKNDFTNLDAVNVTLSDEEVLKEFLPEAVLQFCDLKMMFDWVDS